MQILKWECSTLRCICFFAFNSFFRVDFFLHLSPFCWIEEETQKKKQNGLPNILCIEAHKTLILGLSINTMLQTRNIHKYLPRCVCVFVSSPRFACGGQFFKHILKFIHVFVLLLQSSLSCIVCLFAVRFFVCICVCVCNAY